MHYIFSLTTFTKPHGSSLCGPVATVRLNGVSFDSAINVYAGIIAALAAAKVHTLNVSCIIPTAHPDAKYFFARLQPP